jgi:hypothetical protein
MKAISLYQPWATLVAIGAKKIETRSWGTRYRGPLAIHAAKKWSLQDQSILLKEPFKTVLAGFQEYPLGCILAVTLLEGCFKIYPVPLLISDQEEAFGDYRPGRFMWMLELQRKVEPPIPFRGRQGLFEIPDSLIEAEWRP